MTTELGVWRLLRGGLAMDRSVMESLRDDPDGFAAGLRLIVVVGLVVGLAVGSVALVQGLTADPAAEMEEARAGVREAFDQLESAGLLGSESGEAIQHSFLDNFDAGMTMATRIVGVVEASTPAPMPVVVLFRSLGRWLSLPFTWIALWLAWGALTLIFARMLGGTATIQSMLAVTALVAAPHLLDALGWVPCVGLLIRGLAFLWGLIVYVQATSVANRLSPGLALVAVILPLAIPAGIALGGLFLLGVVIGAAG